MITSEYRQIKKSAIKFFFFKWLLWGIKNINRYYNNQVFTKEQNFSVNNS